MASAEAAVKDGFARAPQIVAADRIAEFKEIEGIYQGLASALSRLLELQAQRDLILSSIVDESVLQICKNLQIVSGGALAVNDYQTASRVAPGRQRRGTTLQSLSPRPHRPFVAEHDFGADAVERRSEDRAHGAGAQDGQAHDGKDLPFRYANVCTITGPATAETGPVSRGPRF